MRVRTQLRTVAAWLWLLLPQPWQRIHHKTELPGPSSLFQPYDGMLHLPHIVTALILCAVHDGPQRMHGGPHVGHLRSFRGT